MADYESEHSIPKDQTGATTPARRRPDLSTFFSNLEHVDTLNSNTSTIPNPTHVTSAYRQLANAYQIMLGETSGVAPSVASAYASDDTDNPLVAQMAALLMRAADNPPETVERVPDSFFDELERVARAELVRRGPDAACPICSIPFLEDKYPLVVRLPCHRDHLFDLECIRPWLSLNVTCPLDRKRLVPEKKEITSPKERQVGPRGGPATSSAAANEDEDEDDVDGMYG